MFFRIFINEKLITLLWHSFQIRVYLTCWKNSIHSYEIFICQQNKQYFLLCYQYIHTIFAKLQIGNIDKWRPIFLGYFWPTYAKFYIYHHVLCLSISHFETISALWCYLWMFPCLSTSWNLLRTSFLNYS